MNAIKLAKIDEIAKVVIRKLLSEDPAYEKIMNEANVEINKNERMASLSSSPKPF